MPKANKRYTPKHSLVSSRQMWAARSENDKDLNEIGRQLVRAAKHSQEKFDQLARELIPETDG